MDKIAEVKQTVRHENWKRMYEEYQRSGMKVSDWCVMQGLSVKTFYYRLKVIREEMLNETDQHDIVPVMQCKTEMPSDMSTTKSDEKIHINGNADTPIFAEALTDLQVLFSRILSLMYVREQYFCFADEDTTESRLYCGKVTVFCCFTSVLTMADFSGRETKQRQNRSQQSNTHG